MELMTPLYWMMRSFAQPWHWLKAQMAPEASATAMRPVAIPAMTDHELSLEVLSGDAPMCGVPCTLDLRLIDTTTGQPLTQAQLAVVHSERFHLLVVDETLQDYHHLHPQPTATAGVFRCQFTPQTDHGYHLWADVTAARTGRNHLLHRQLVGKVKAVPALAASASQAQREGVVIDWQSDRPVRAGCDSLITLTVRDAVTGQPVTSLQPLLGAYAHLVGFGADGHSFIHSHPLESDSDIEQARTGVLRFHLRPEQAGSTQFYVQINRGGQLITLPIVQQVQPAITMAEAVAVSRGSADRLPQASGRGQ